MRPAERRPQGGGDRISTSRLVMVLNVVLIAGVAIIGLTHVSGLQTDDPATGGGPTGGPASTLADPNAEPSGVAGHTPASDPPATAPAPSTPSASQPAADVRPPRVKARMRSNFAAGDPWPYAADFRETGRMAWPLGVVDRLMTHGQPLGPNAVSWLQRWMDTDVRVIGARVRFAPNHSGSAAMTAWHTSVLDTTGLSQPRTGMRLLMQPGAWQLVALDNHGQSTLSSGTYTQRGHTATFSMVRRGNTIWVTDPEGLVTKVQDPRVGGLSGPWASWELRDATTESRPAGFQEIWAG